MTLNSTYESAVSWIEEAARECQKTENVDIDKLISNCTNCIDSVDALLSMEHQSIRLEALEQVSNSLHHHTKLLVKKKEQLSSGVKNIPTDGVKSSNEKDSDGQERRFNVLHGINNIAANCLHDILIFLSYFSRRIAIEDTIISKGFVKFSDVAGLEEAKNTLSEAIVLPLQYPHFFTG